MAASKNAVVKPPAGAARKTCGKPAPAVHLRRIEASGRQFDVTRERVRQIEAKAIRQLNHPSRCDKLRTCLDALQ